MVGELKRVCVRFAPAGQAGPCRLHRDGRESDPVMGLGRAQPNAGGARSGGNRLLACRCCFLVQIGEDLVDQRPIFDAGDDPKRAAAAPGAGLDVDLEHPLEALRLRHRGPGLGWCLVLRGIRGLRLVALTRSRRGHQRTMLAVAREHAVVAPQVNPGLGRHCRECCDEVQRLEDDMGRAVAGWRLDLVAHVASGRG